MIKFPTQPKSNEVEITGRYIRETQRFANDSGDIVVARIHIPEQGEMSVKGPANYGQLVPGLDYRFYGRHTTYKNKRRNKTEKQFSFRSVERLEPVGREAIVGYLVSQGEGLGLGRVRAAKLWEIFGDKAVETMRTDPEAAATALGKHRLPFRSESAKLLSEKLIAEEATEAIKLDLTHLLDGRGFPRNIVDRVIELWGNNAARIVRRDPYRLLLAGIKGCGFKRCDAMYLDLGLNPSRLKRQALCAWFAISRDSDGHTWFDWKTPNAFLKANIGGAKLRGADALELAVRGGLLAEQRTEGSTGPLNDQGSTVWYAEKPKADNEESTSDQILTSRRESPFWPKLDGLNLTDHQKEIATAALNSAICILGGGPGTGKTWTVAEIVSALASDPRIGLDNIAIGCPTGKAAVRVTENLEAKEIPLRARTWHSLLLGMEMKNEKYFSQKVLIGDESSMLDSDLMAAIIRARAAGSVLLLVGDVHQLPPVGHGAPLRDMIAAGVPYGELTKIERNSGGIVETCKAIRECTPWSPGDNLHMIETADKHLEKIKGIIQQAKADSLDPVWDLQIVTAVNEKSQLSRKVLNVELQRMLNHQPGEEGSRAFAAGFRVGDKVVNTKNGFFKAYGSVGLDGEEVQSNEKDEVYVANGELAKVAEITKATMILDLESPPRRIEVFFGAEGGCTFELGYALSVHKSQGSDWPWVVVILDDYPGARMVCDRSWLYTAISRAKDRCFLVGQKSVANRMVKTSKIWHRKTFLKELILREQSRRCLADV